MLVYIGIDWSEEKHDAVFMNQAGADLAKITFSHKQDGFLQFDAMRRKLGLAAEECVVGIETAHSLLFDYLCNQAYHGIFVLPPNQVHDNQGRFRQSGAKDDPMDARVIADILRTDQGRLRSWHPDSLLIRQMRAELGWIIQLNEEVHRLSNRLRAVLLRYYPAALEVFSTGLTTQIAPEFILAYPEPQLSRALSWSEFQAFAKAHRYPNSGRLAKCYARLQADYPETSPATASIFQKQAVELAELLLKTTRTKLDNLRHLQALHRQHPLHSVFDSLPGAGEWISPALLAKFGDQPEHFPHASVAQALAGTCPITKRSGKHKAVLFRHACDKEWRHIAQEWAVALVNRASSPIAVAYFEQARRRGLSEDHAYRCVAHRWLAVAWKLWTTNQPYDEAYHFQQHALRSKAH